MITAYETAGEIFNTLKKARAEANKHLTDILLIEIHTERGAFISNDFYTLFSYHPQSEKFEQKHTVKQAKQYLLNLKK